MTYITEAVNRFLAGEGLLPGWLVLLAILGWALNYRQRIGNLTLDRLEKAITTIGNDSTVFSIHIQAATWILYRQWLIRSHDFNRQKFVTPIVASVSFFVPLLLKSKFIVDRPSDSLVNSIATISTAICFAATLWLIYLIVQYPALRQIEKGVNVFLISPNQEGKKWDATNS